MLRRGRIELRRRIRIEQSVGRIEHTRAMLRQFLRDPQPISVGQVDTRSDARTGRRHQMVDAKLRGAIQQVRVDVGRQLRRVRLDSLFLQPDFAPDKTADRIDDEVEFFTHDPPSGP